MEKTSLPEEIRGEWIWRSDAVARLESHVFFRKEFTLAETPASAELWITARTLCHVYINGRYVGFGPPPAPGDSAYVMYLDLGFLCETGKNTIAILASNTSVGRYAARRQAGGLWCQINIDDAPVVWTDRSWLCLDAQCYVRRRPRASVSSGFTEKMDFRDYPAQWEEKEFNPARWTHPDHTQSLGKARVQLVPLSGSPWNAERRSFVSAIGPSTFSHAAAVSHISFAELAEERGRGVYAAEAYWFCDKAPEAPLDMEIYSDDPYCLYLNGEMVKRQGIAPVTPKVDMSVCVPRCFRQAGTDTPEAEVRLVAGWNVLTFVQQTELDSVGATFLFPTLKPDELRLVRKDSDDATTGWAVTGPIRTPLPLVNAPLDLGHLPKTIYVPTEEEPVDETALLMSFAFEKSDTVGDAPDPIPLQQGEFIVLDLETVLFGCPELTVTGEEGDILDVVWGERVVEGQLLCYRSGQRHVDTLVLSDQTCTWRARDPRGLRYLMLVARRCSATIMVENIGVAHREYLFDNAGAFSSADDTLNQIWETSCRTLRATMQEAFVDSPTRANAQYVADAMIQSWAAYHSFGSFALAAKSLREFARAQFETGELPALCPSDFHVNTPDSALLWPVWLQRHYMYTGDRAFLDECTPTLERLFNYYAFLAGPGDEVLQDLDRQNAAYCFLDHGPIDRQGLVTGLNAIYCRALLSGAWLLKEMDQPDAAHQLRKRAGAVAHRVRDLTWDAERGLFADGWKNGEMSDFYSWQTNVLAIYGGIAEASAYDSIFDKIFSDEEPYELFAAGATNNPFFKYFILEAAFALGRRTWAVNMLRWYWGGMIARGAKTWWEFFDPEGNPEDAPDGSMCHGYGTSPNGFLCAEVAGVRPAKPGFTTIYFNPLVGVTDWVKCQVPTPYGRINAEWSRGDDGHLEAVIDSNYPLEVVPMLSADLAASATIHVSESVSILAEQA